MIKMVLKEMIGIVFLNQQKDKKIMKGIKLSGKINYINS